MSEHERKGRNFERERERQRERERERERLLKYIPARQIMLLK